ncbi:MAG TPA: hypothetical protein VL943_08655, partial [Niabella sp.]|nr:hypothetical protein [Niabella sp.]
KQELAARLDLWNRSSKDIPPANVTPIPPGAITGQLVDVKALNEPEDIVLHKGHAFIPCRDGNNVAIIDYRNPAKPFIACNLKDEDILDAFSVAIEGDHLFVLSMTNATVSVYNIAAPSRPRKVAALKVGNEGSYLHTYRSNYTRLRKIMIQNGYAYVTHSSESKVYILDVKNPAKPQITSSFHTGDGAFAALVNNNVLYLAGYGPGSSVITVDVKDKLHPVITSRVYDSVKLKGTCALAISGNYLYTTAYDAGSILSLDITNPLQPKPVMYLNHNSMRGLGRIAFSGKKAYILNSVNNSVGVVHANANGRMQIETFLQHALLKRVYGIAIDKNLLLLAGREAKSFLVIDINKL